MCARPLRNVPVVMITAPQANVSPIHQAHATHTAVFDTKRRHFSLLDPEVRLALKHFLHPYAILLLIALRPRRPNRRTAAGIQQTKLNPHGVGDLAHNATQRIDLPHKMTLRNSADRRVAGHLCNQIRIHRDHHRAQSHAGTGTRGLAPGVTASHYHDVERLIHTLLL